MLLKGTHRTHISHVKFTAPVVSTPVVEPDVPEVSGEPKDETIAATPSAARSTDGEGLRAGAIAAMSVGGALLLIGAVVLQRRKRSNESSNLSAMDSTSVQPSGEDAA
jgi:hypothetical protein